jgi:hypothetical protein
VIGCGASEADEEACAHWRGSAMRTGLLFGGLLAEQLEVRTIQSGYDYAVKLTAWLVQDILLNANEW